MHLEHHRKDTGKPTTDDVVCALILAAFIAAILKAPDILNFLGIFN